MATQDKLVGLLYNICDFKGYSLTFTKNHEKIKGGTRIWRTYISVKTQNYGDFYYGPVTDSGLSSILLSIIGEVSTEMKKSEIQAQSPPETPSIPVPTSPPGPLPLPRVYPLDYHAVDDPSPASKQSLPAQHQNKYKILIIEDLSY
jgi:hypothetical protein